MSGRISCIIALLILTLMLIVVISNAIYVKKTADKILSLIDSSERLDSGTASTVASISDYWNKRISVLKLSLSQEELENISLDINEAIICAENHEEEEYKKSMARLRRAIEGIKKREEFSLENIF